MSFSGSRCACRAVIGGLPWALAAVFQWMRSVVPSLTHVGQISGREADNLSREIEKSTPTISECLLSLSQSTCHNLDQRVPFDWPPADYRILLSKARPRDSSPL
jgi:hypothetical protein